jgi:hypothetical protein
MQYCSTIVKNNVESTKTTDCALPLNICTYFCALLNDIYFINLL